MELKIKMKKINLYKILYVISIVLLFIYVFILILDYINYNPTETSFPFYSTVIVRTMEFVIPSLLFLIFGIIMMKRKK